MKEPFAYVLYIEPDDAEPAISLYRTLDEAEDALRAYAATLFCRLNDDEIVATLAEESVRARIFACTTKRKAQLSNELEPFTRAAKAA